MKNQRQMNKMIAYCGIDCEKCDAYIATKNNDQALREKTAELWSEMNKAPIMPEMIECEGCRAGGKRTAFCEHMCAIRPCAIKKGMATCGDCAENKRCPKVAVIWRNNADAEERLTQKKAGENK